jgi:DNA-directed RNA polymerase specialized sigma24 family protein
MPKTEPDSDESALSRRLDAIIALLAHDNKREIGENMVTLSDAGLKSAEIARILGRSDSYVRGELSRRRKTMKMIEPASPEGV